MVLLALAMKRPNPIFGTKEEPRDIGFIMIDEAHTLVDAMQLLLSSAFAPIFLQGRLTSLLKQESEWEKWKKRRGMKSLYDKVKKLRNIIAREAPRFCDKNKIGTTYVLDFLQDKNFFVVHARWLEDIYSVGKTVKEKLQGLVDFTANKKVVRIINSICVEIDELRQVVSVFRKDIKAGEDEKRPRLAFVTYSPKKGNPNYSATSNSAYLMLKYNFWPTVAKKRKIRVAVLSGTFFIRRGETYPINVLGMGHEGIADMERLLSKTDVSWHYVMPSTVKKREMMNMEVYDDIFPPDMKKFETPEEKEDAQRKWIDNLAARINQIYSERPYRTLVLLGSFLDSEALGKTLVKQYNWVDSGSSRILWYCSREQSTSVLLRQFMKVQQGVFIGMKSFWTGHDIPDLINLIIARLPWDCPYSIKWLEQQESFRRSTGKKNGHFFKYQRTMLLDFKQGCGRLIRFKQPDLPVKPTLFVLDARIKTVPGGYTYEDMEKLAYGELL
jgi:Rad3-related DNA helicase